MPWIDEGGDVDALTVNKENNLVVWSKGIYNMSKEKAVQYRARWIVFWTQSSNSVLPTQPSFGDGSECMSLW